MSNRLKLVLLHFGMLGIRNKTIRVFKRGCYFTFIGFTIMVIFLTGAGLTSAAEHIQQEAREDAVISLMLNQPLSQVTQFIITREVL